MNAFPLKKQIDRPIHELRPAKILIPIMPDSDNQSLLRLAHWLAQSEPVLLLGVVPVPLGENLSAGATQARVLRDLLQEHSDRVNLRAKPRIRVSDAPWDDIRAALIKEPGIELLILSWPDHFKMLRLMPAEILSHPPCDVAVVRGPLPEKLERVLVPMRGGPHAERALSLALALAKPVEAQVSSLRLRPTDRAEHTRGSFAGMAQVLAELPEVEQQNIDTDDQSATILEAARSADLIVMGMAAFPTKSTASFGEIADITLAQAPAAVIVVKTRRVLPEGDSRFGVTAISVLVDRWFAENTFHADEFDDLNRLLALKKEQKVKISLALPALNEEETIGEVLSQCQRLMQADMPLLDEIVVVDSDSTDRTREIARAMGVPVFIHQQVLPEYGARPGKGEALWKSLYLTSGDIVIWVDTDISNFHPRFVYGLIGPLLQRPNLMFVKGFYRRPLKAGKELQPGRGGRVTELTARPLLNLFYPELSGIVQPLAGEYGGRRPALERVSFTSGYGVETSILIDIFERYKLASIAQVDLVERIHRNQTLPRLSQMSFAIIQTFFSKLERRYGHEMLKDVNRTMKTVHYEPGHFYLEVAEIAEEERPPMIEIPEYQEKFNRT
jgi:glycosyltransferase involved in cell wall biosynthesis/nucleotide-binding universal stress UspA family protein